MLSPASWGGQEAFSHYWEARPELCGLQEDDTG